MNNKHIKTFAFTLLLLAMVGVLLAACGRPGVGSGTAGTSSGSSGSSATNGGASPTASTPTSGSSSSSSGGATVHMGTTNFLQSTVTISKGSSLTLIDDAAMVHQIENGYWTSNGTPHPVKEKGAPTVNVSFTGNDTHTVGPFNTAGTFHLYCTIHTGMNLTVTVK